MHKPSGRGRTRINGKDYYFTGHFDSPKSRAEYDALVGKWLKKQQDASHPQTTVLSIDDLVLTYLDHAREHYRKNGEPTSK